MTDDVPPADRGRMQWLVVGLIGLAGLAAVAAVAAIFFAGAGEEDEALDVPGTPARQASLGSAWVGPPADADPADLVPQAVGAWDLTASADDDGGGNAMLGLDLPARHGTYGKVGTAHSAELFVYRADAAEAKSRIAAARGKLDDAGRFGAADFKTPALRGASETLKFDVPEGEGTPELHGLLAAADGWLLFVRSPTQDELEPFLAEYMRTVESDGTAEAPTDAPAPGGYAGQGDPPPGDTTPAE